ncbi:MAG: aminoacetone oxidase family FAD-binding enzyme, partial [Clostridia bacterium]|nr:aminoacetone oxidase family FAD-binding enzyme [Clostridia bacterium]
MIVVIGGGPAGMISAYFKAINGNEVLLIEKNEKLGKKLYITGKGRCNVTNNCEVEDFLDNVVTNSKFLTGIARRFTPSDFMAFLSEKVKLKTERGRRVYPVSDKASDITVCLESYLRDAGVKISLNEKVVDIIIEENQIKGVVTDKRKISCDEVIVCTGGASYPLTGSTGDGYKFARKAGHTVQPIKPSLVGINLKGDLYKGLQGVSLKNVGISVKRGDKVIFEDFGEALFTHFGISGPIVLTASSYLNKIDLADIDIYFDLKPALSLEQLDDRLLRDFEKYKNKQIKNSLGDLLIRSLIPIVIEQAGINGEIKNSQFSREERKKLLNV